MGKVPGKPPKAPPEGFKFSEDFLKERRLSELERRVRRSENSSDYGVDLLKIGFWTGLFR